MKRTLRSKLNKEHWQAHERQHTRWGTHTPTRSDTAPLGLCVSFFLHVSLSLTEDSAVWLKDRPADSAAHHTRTTASATPATDAAPADESLPYTSALPTPKTLIGCKRLPRDMADPGVGKVELQGV